ncbi:MAG: HD domain-containing phosphohydrolase [Candidatus Omnitrophota bacterium]
MKDNSGYQQQLFEKLSKSYDLKKESEILGGLFKDSFLWIVDSASALEADAQGKKNQIKHVIELCAPESDALCTHHCTLSKSAVRSKCLGCISGALQRAKKTHSIEKFSCDNHLYGLCFPLSQGDALYGFLILCSLKQEPTPESLRLFEALNSTILEKIQKELELSKLYETIRPRAIALSTVHTIHRLISSSLDLDELLPRIARLSLQVLRSKRCLISLVDKKSKQLVSKAFIDVSKKKACVSAFQKTLEKKVLHSGRIVLNKAYLSVPFVDEEPLGVISVFDKMSGRPFDNFDLEILNALAEQATGAIKNAQMYREQEHLLSGTVKFISTLLKLKSGAPYTHSKHIVEIIMHIAKELSLSSEELRNLRYAAMLHDAEKIGIPEEILKKPTPLTIKEYKIVKEHPRKSARILSPMERLRPAVGIIMHHHEKFDGTGYPDKLKGEQIPIGARIMAVADSLEAMISLRPYRQSTTIAEAIKELKSKSGTQFDPRVIKAFLKLIKRKTFKRLLKGIQNDRSKKSL